MINLSVSKDDDLDLDDDKSRIGSAIRSAAVEEGFSPAVDQSSRRDLEPMNLTFTP